MKGKEEVFFKLEFIAFNGLHLLGRESVMVFN